MNFSEFWELVLERNPGLRDTTAVNFEVTKFREVIMEAFDAGRMAGDDAGYERGLRAAAARTAAVAVPPGEA